MSTTNFNEHRRGLAFSKRLTEAFNTDKPAEIAKKLGITYQGAKNYLEGRIPAPDTLVEISRSTGYSIHWLLTGEGPKAIHGGGALEPGQIPVYFGDYEQEKIRELAAKENKSFEVKIRDIVMDELKKLGLVATQAESNVVFYGEPVRSVELPLMGWIAAGEPIHLVAEEQSVRVPDFMMKPGKKHFVLHVRGDSMVEDHIPDGSLIICEARQTAQEGEKVVAVIGGDRVTVKRLYHEGDRIRLQPANPSHQPIYVTPDETLDIQGVVVAVFHQT